LSRPPAKKLTRNLSSAIPVFNVSAHSMKRYLLFLFLINHFVGFSQAADSSCDCEKDFAFITNYLENHYSAFQTNVTETNRSEYSKLKNELTNKLKQPLSKFDCLDILKQYTAFFKDNHLSVSLPLSGPTIDETSSEAVKQFKSSDLFKDWERIEFDSIKIWNYLAQSSDPLEGIYQDATYQVAVLKNQNATRDYYGVITQSKTALWEKGQVKLQFKRKDDASYQTVLYMRNHSANVSTIKSENPTLSVLNCTRIFPTTNTTATPARARSLPPSNAWFLFKKLDDSTNYLYMGTFNGSLRSKFDSAYKAIMPELTRRPRLIIDIRSNGGGSDACWQELARLLYTDPVPLDKWEYFASTEIIKRYEEQLTDMQKRRQEYGEGAIDHYESIIKRLKKAKLGTFVPAGGDETYTQKKIQATPAKVIVMFNRQSASAAEGFVLNVMHSKKVLTFGENSGGYIAYGNIMSVNTPSGFRLNSGTHRVLNRVQYEKTGITPHVLANNEEDWIEQARKLLDRIN
jgi:hypothetical protein